jgi:hypothetical protein
MQTAHKPGEHRQVLLTYSQKDCIRSVPGSRHTLLTQGLFALQAEPNLLRTGSTPQCTHVIMTGTETESW